MIFAAFLAVFSTPAAIAPIIAVQASLSGVAMGSAVRVAEETDDEVHVTFMVRTPDAKPLPGVRIWAIVEGTDGEM